MTRNTGGPAYPHAVKTVHFDSSARIETHHGMTVWDVFFAAALQGFCSTGNSSDRHVYVKAAADVADAAIAERARRMGE